MRKQREISEVFQRGKRRRGRYMDVVALPRDHGVLRYLFVTSRRVGNAVVRNRVRRRLREAVRALRDETKPGHDIALVSFPTAASADYRELASELRRLMERAGLLAGGPGA